MKVSLLKEDKIEQIVKYCMRIFEQERAECFVSSLNVIQTFQQLTIVRNLFFNNAIKAFGVLNDTTGEIEKIMIVRLADAIEYTAVIEIIISSLDSEFVGCCINELKDYFEDSYYSKVKINIIDKDLEDSCNLRCKHCIVGTTSYPPSISLEKAKKVIDKCHESGVDNIVLSTKEPFMYPYITEVIDYCSLYKIKIAIITNGTLIDEKKLKNLLDNSETINYIAFSLEGVSPETNDFVRGEGVFEKVMSVVSKIDKINKTEKKNIKLILQMNLTSKNYEEVPDMVNILNTFPFVQVAIGKLYIDGNAAFYKELDLDNWKYEEAISTLISSYIRIERPNYELTFKDISVFDAIFFNTVFGTSYKPNIPDCSIFYGGYSLMSNGNYCACSLLLDKGLIENEKLDLGKFDDSDKIETTKKFQIGSEYFDYKECEVCCECPFKKQCQMCLLIGLSKENRIYQIEKCRFYFNKLKRLLNEVINNRLPFQLNPNVVIVSAGKEWTVYNSLIGEHELWRFKTKKEDEINMIRNLQDNGSCCFREFAMGNNEDKSRALLEKLLLANLLFVNKGDK